MNPLVDGPARRRPRGRAAAVSIIPTTTGAARATELVLPTLAGRISGMAMRVPVPDGSVTDLVAQLHKDATAQEVNDAFRLAAAGPGMEGVLGVSENRLVSIDIIGDPRSAVIDAPTPTCHMGQWSRSLPGTTTNGDIRLAWSISLSSCPRIVNPLDNGARRRIELRPQDCERRRTQQYPASGASTASTSDPAPSIIPCTRAKLRSQVIARSCSRST